MSTRIADKKGRLFLGSPFAGRMVIINDSDPNRIVITQVVAIPEHEAWLFRHDEARKRVLAGLDQARKREFSAPSPDLDADAAVADAVPD
jgi:hypothetical protein